MKRGTVVTVALQGDQGKPRPAVIVETDRLASTAHVLICPGTSTILGDTYPRRLLVERSPTNGLTAATQFQADKLSVTRRSKIGKVIGRLSDDEIEKLNGALFVMIGLAD